MRSGTALCPGLPRGVLPGLLRGVGFALALVTVTAPALASSGLDSPDVGVVPVGRGGAWLARADDPLAVYLNPAAMSFQATGVHLGAHLMFAEQCFTRVGEDGEPVSPGSNLPGPGAPGGADAAVCANTVFPNPQLAGVLRLNEELALGLAVLGPHAVGGVEWPESIDYPGPTETQPSPNRYLLVTNDALLVFPTLSVSYRVLPELALGAGFTWGIASVEFTNFTESISPSPAVGELASDDFFTHGDVRTTLRAKDLFVPGFVVGALWTAADALDVAAWYRWSDAVDASTSLDLESRYFGQNGLRDEQPCAGEAADCNLTTEEDAGTLKFSIPMEAKVAVRLHYPREGAKERPTFAPRGGKTIRDPLSQDLFDVEVDLTWANNSAVDAVEIRFKDGIPVNGTPGALPPNADIPHEWRDVIGVRLGGDFVAVPNLLALRAGGFFESKGQDDEYLNLDFHLGERIGLGGGATVRLGPVDVSAAYNHTFYGAIDNGGKGAVKAISGDATTGYRSRQAVNGGRLEANLNEISLGGTLRF